MHIDHITIRTSKLEGSIDFYEKIAGLRIVRDLRQVKAIAAAEFQSDSIRTTQPDTGKSF